MPIVYGCQFCEMDQGSPEKLALHQRIPHTARCPVDGCKQSYIHLESLNAHLRIVHNTALPNPMNLLRCSGCDERFLTKAEFDKHTCPAPPVARDHHNEPVEAFKSGAASSVKARFKLIPYAALVAMANRFQLGLEKHKEKAYNALSSQDPLFDNDWVEARVEHTIDHCYLWLLRRRGLIPDDGDDDAGAVLFGGAVMAASDAARGRDKGMKHLREQAKEHNRKEASNITDVVQGLLRERGILVPDLIKVENLIFDYLERKA